MNTTKPVYTITGGKYKGCTCNPIFGSDTYSTVMVHTPTGNVTAKIRNSNIDRGDAR